MAAVDGQVRSWTRHCLLQRFEGVDKTDILLIGYVLHGVDVKLNLLVIQVGSVNSFYVLVGDG